MNALGMKQVYTIVQITTKSVLPPRGSFQGQSLIVNVSRNE